jgi:nucleoside-diphosphate-sugar epimerase
MKVYVAGGAGAIGRQLVPMLVAAGHSVTATTRSPERVRWLASVGARGVVVDALDAQTLRASVREASPAVVIHQLTSLAAGFGPAELRATAHLREVGTLHLARAAAEAGARRIVAQSAAWLYADGPQPHDEGQALRSLDDDPDNVTLRGIVALERGLLEAGPPEIVILRYGFLYGPHTGAATADAAPEPRVSVEAAARAAQLAVDGGAPGVYNVVDDGDVVSNRRIREELGWSPQH